MIFSQVQQQPFFLWFLQNNYSLMLLLMAILISLVGLFLCFIPNRIASIILVFVSFLPGLLALGLVYWAAAEFSALASSQAAPEPTEFARVISQALASGFCGLLATLIPMLIAIIALVRSTSEKRPHVEQIDQP